MTRYYIEAHHKITAEEFDSDCGTQVDEYTDSSIVEATDPIDALASFTKKMFSRKFRKDRLMTTDSSYCYSFLENSNGDEPDISEIMNWKEGELPLYDNFVVFKVFELKEINYVTK